MDRSITYQNASSSAASRLTFAGSKFTARRGDEEPQEGSYVIEPRKNPRRIDITRGNGPTTTSAACSGDYRNFC